MPNAIYRAFGINLDLALEAREIVRGETGREIPGVRVDQENYEHAQVTIVNIMEPSAEVIMGKPVGIYITIESPVIRENNPTAHQEISEILARQLTPFTSLPEYANILLVGLGNWRATPDALGPKVIELSLVTRHLFNYAPQALKRGMRSVSALAPGVLGITGIETAEIIKGVVERIRPELIVTIDSLAARSVTRIGTTIQIANTGIKPGSGIGNQRTGINQETMGVPVVAIGVPTVVHAAVIAQDTINRFLEQLNTDRDLHQSYGQLNPEFSHQVITEILEPFGGELTVTPKEIDTLINSTAKILASGLSLALHPDLTPEDYTFYLH
ncbi:MAG TPA: GPR endopeptidase [Desulfotomaculum sp.]|jgi:spore protease|nr:GPR endopeptidase [Desulfotomaculum sp.]